MSDSIVTRNLPDSLKPALRRRAAANGRSMEAEARAILEDAAARDDFVLSWLDGLRAQTLGAPPAAPERAERGRRTVTCG